MSILTRNPSILKKAFYFEKVSTFRQFLKEKKQRIFQIGRLFPFWEGRIYKKLFITY